ncbi:MAG: hypothetical protein LBS94_04055 [Prevotellaceae bacterium]|jgi:hypothetical protein|nr:hypothetical protein [Prevotellaceae bacterium]
MELEELKAGWSLLSERLERSEVVNRRIVREMVAKRTQTAYGKIQSWNVLGLAICLGMMIVLYVLAVIGPYKLPLSLLVAGEVMLGLTCVWQAVKLSFIGRFRMDKNSVLELSKWTLRYRRLIKREEVVGVLLVVTFLAVYYLLYFQHSVKLSILFVMATIVAVALSYLCYRYVERKNVDAIGQGLEELGSMEG